MRRAPAAAKASADRRPRVGGDDHRRLVVPNPLREEGEHRLRAQFSRLPVGAWHVGHRRPVDQGRADPREDLVTRAHATPHHSRNVCGGKAGRSRVRPQAASGPGGKWVIQPSLATGRCNVRPSLWARS